MGRGRGIVLERPNDVALRVRDGQDHGALDESPCVGYGAIRRHEVGRPDLDCSDADRHAGIRVRGEGQPEVLRSLHQVVDAVDRGGLHSRDVERVLDGLPHTYRAALIVVGVMGRVPAAHVGGYVHEQRRCGHGLILETDHVVDRLERRTRLTVAVAQNIELRIEQILPRVSRVRHGLLIKPGAARVGEYLTSSVVDRYQGPVVHVGGAQTGGQTGRWVRPYDSVVVVRVRLNGDANARLRQVVNRRRLRSEIGSHDVGLQPLLGRSLHRCVERRDHLVAADIHLLTVGGVDAGAAQQGGQLFAHLLVELRGDQVVLRLRMNDHRLRLGRENVRVVVLPSQQAIQLVLAHVLEDFVAAQDDRRTGRNDECPVGLLDGVLNQVIGGGGLQQGRDDDTLGDRQTAQIRDPEIALGGRRNAVALIAVEVQVQVGGDDRLFAFQARELLSELHGLDYLLDLAVHEAGGRREELLPDELLGDRGGTSRAPGEGVAERRQHGGRIEPGVRPEGLVFRARGGIEDHVGNVAELQDAAVFRAVRGQLDLPGLVVEGRLLVEVDALEKLPGILEIAAIGGIDVHRPDEADRPQQHHAREENHRENHREAADGPPSGSTPTVTATALAAGEAGLHGGSQDSIRTEAVIAPPAAGSSDGPMAKPVTTVRSGSGDGCS